MICFFRRRGWVLVWFMVHRPIPMMIAIRYGNETCARMGMVLGTGIRHHAITWGMRQRHALMCGME